MYYIWLIIKIRVSTLVVYQFKIDTKCNLTHSDIKTVLAS